MASAGAGGVLCMDKMQFLEILRRFDTVIELLRISTKPKPLFNRIADGIVTGIAILSIISIIDILKSWIGG
jgi:hypothetical protein